MGAGRRTTDPAALETLKAIRQIAVSLGKGLPMEALAVAGNCVIHLESKAPLNDQQKEAARQFLQTLHFNKAPLGAAEAGKLAARTEALVGAAREPASESAGGDRVPVSDEAPEFKSILGAVRSYEDRLEMMQLDRSLSKMPKDKARAFLQAMMDALQATRKRYANPRIEDAANRVLQKAKDAYRAI